jgi:hypothetical protein
MWRFLRSPRRVLATVLIACCVCLPCMIVYAYSDRPRIEIKSVDEGSVELFLSALAAETGETYVYRIWTCADQSNGHDLNCKELSARLNSTDFLRQYKEVAIQRYGRLSQLFAGAGSGRLAFRCEKSEHIARTVLAPPDAKVDYFAGVMVWGILSKRFSVHRPTYEWSGWLQAHLPFLPDRVELQTEADEFNQDAVDVLDAQLRLVDPNREWKKYWP